MNIFGTSLGAVTATVPVGSTRTLKFLVLATLFSV
jgi:hypothetical protein